MLKNRVHSRFAVMVIIGNFVRNR